MGEFGNDTPKLALSLGIPIKPYYGTFGVMRFLTKDDLIKGKLVLENLCLLFRCFGQSTNGHTDRSIKNTLCYLLNNLSQLNAAYKYTKIEITPDDPFNTLLSGGQCWNSD